uniref:alanine transaminase n=2 Tax=Parascaris TaxID=6254 RepID=A0A915C977_PARUN
NSFTRTAHGRFQSGVDGNMVSEEHAIQELAAENARLKKELEAVKRELLDARGKVEEARSEAMRVPATAFQLLRKSGRCLSTGATLAGAKKGLTMETINPNVKCMEFAVRGPIVIRGAEIEKDLEKGAKKPFNSVVKANIGDAHDMGQKPITFIRQVVACCAYPPLLQSMAIPSDVRKHAEAILHDCGGHSVGAYTPSAGIECIRKHCAEYITRRDGIPTDYENIVLSAGTTEGIRNVLKLFVNTESSRKVGIMIPIPQYPLYSATLDEFGLGQVRYYLDEDNMWALNIGECERALNEAKGKYDTRAICVINPGNPAGQVLTKKNIEEIIRFARKNNLVILADEVYQDNIFDESSKFYSFKKVLHDMGDEYKDQELVSFYSVSKGYMGECGLRAGYIEFMNIDQDVFKMFMKMISAKLCSSALGQAALDCAVNPPKPGEPSYELWYKEKTGILKSLKERARLVKEAYGALEGIECNPVQGAMYAFPKINLPEKAIEEAKKQNVAPDFLYGMKMIEATGICTVPGSGFGQQEGTYHFRTTILPQTDLMKEMLDRFKPFHADFMKTYK